MLRWENGVSVGYDDVKTNEILDQIDRELTINPEPRNNGKWIGKEKYMNSPEYFSWQCSVCCCVLEDPSLDEPYPFCPYCGADMRGGQR